MGCISLPTALLGSSLISGAGSLFSGASQASAAEQAGQLQYQAAMSAQQDQMTEFDRTQKALHPFVGAGQSAIGTLQALTGTGKGGNPLTAPLTSTFQPTMAQLAATPGYQFTLAQGEQATQNAAAAQGLGQSGAALKGAANYAEGLAGTTYQQQFQNYLGQNQQIYNMISGQAGLGESAAAQQGSLGTQNVATANQFGTSGAAASAAGLVGGAAALGGGVASAASSLGNAGLLYGLSSNGGGIFGGNAGNADVGMAAAGQAGLAAGLKLNADGSIE